MSSRAPARPLRGRGVDRGQVLARVDLPAAADRFLGPAVGTGPRRRWVCPHPDHPAGDAAAAVTVFAGRDGTQRWRCRTCGEHGTALDLVMLTQQRDFTEALRLLDDLADQLQPPATEDAQPPRPARVRVPRETLLAQFDLRELADELLGAGRGKGRSRTWRCPLPQHGPQTGRTPPVTVYARGGIPRWRCQACGEGGTAIDMVMAARTVGTGEAFELLLDRLGGRPLTPTRPVPVPASPSGPSPRSRAAVADHVDRCEQLLWSDLGLPGRGFLARRALDEPVLRANRVGYDPGPALLPRRRGLPRAGPAVVLPVLDGQGQPVYLQARYLDPAGDRPYGNPAETLAGPSPRVAFPRPPGPEVDTGVVVVCEGQIDALSAAQAGYAAAAVLAAGLPDERVAGALLDRYPDRRLVLAFDDDTAGRNGAAKLARLLADHGADPARVTTLTPPHGDLNEWLRTTRSAFGYELRHRVDVATPVIPPESPQAPVPEGSPAMPPTEYRVQVWHTRPITADAAAPGYAHVHTFTVPAGLLHEEAAAQRSPERRGDLPRLAAELAVDMGGYDDPASYREPYAGLARGYHARALRPTGISDVVVVTAPDGSATSLEWTADGFRRLSGRPPATTTPAPPAPTTAVGRSVSSASEQAPEYTVRVLYLLPEASPDAGSLAQVYTAVVPADLVRGLQNRERAAGRDVEPRTAAAQVVYDMGNREPEQLIAVQTHLTRLPYAMVDRSPSPGDVFLVGTPDGQVTAVASTSRGMHRLAATPPFLPLDPGTPARGPATPAPNDDYRVELLLPVPSQAVRGITLQASDYDHVHTLAIPAALVRAAVDREVAAGEPSSAAERAAEMVFTIGNAEPGDLDEPYASLARDYRAADLPSLSVGHVLLVTAPDGASQALQCDSVGWRQLDEPPAFGPPGHNTDPPQVTQGADGPTLSDSARAEMVTALQQIYGPADGPELGLDL